MGERSAQWIADTAGGRLVAGDPGAVAPAGAAVDSRELRPGDLFVGIPGERDIDGGSFAAHAVERGAWGVVVDPRWTGSVAGCGAVVIEVDDADAALMTLAAAWRPHLAAHVIGVTGSTGKTSTKDILRDLLAPHMRVHASRKSFNTRWGVAATVLGAPPDSEALVVEMGMRERGQIGRHCALARPTAGILTKIAPDHLETAGGIEAVAAGKAELIAALPPGAPCVLPHGEPLLAPHRRDDLDTITVGPGGDAWLEDAAPGAVTVRVRDERIVLDPSFEEAHNLANLVPAVALARALGVPVGGPLTVSFSPNRGQAVELAPGVTAVLDCAKTSPDALDAALAELRRSPARRRIAVLGALPDLGDSEGVLHRAAGEQARAQGVDVLIAVGEPARQFLAGYDGEAHTVADPREAGALLRDLARPGDRILLKGRRVMELERIADGSWAQD